ncbi:hypothetical protein PFICI_02981 [Pestalotiopsis fici W106-1]|uniref:Trichodiene synthase n=1 Tax=Pestalotiopsis fici (strain W106-1 / CGMCC3.15140) TaxID=1229662 RepID=W3XI79_PESFW|nr:uncharacterized protein PFICI_02981 [Pestalotiopsis fici W106-1]ETS84956.1 hypothetical protein PFICI_02981 [Pestalotiopsis fici W106-1]
MAPIISEADLASIRETLSLFVSGVTGGSKIDEDALTVTNFEELRARVVSELESTSLRDHMDFLNSKNQLNLACHVAADFAYGRGLDYQVLYAMVTIFFFHVEDVLEHNTDVLQNFLLRLARGECLGDPVLNWFARELGPLLRKHFEPLVANMITVACFDFLNGFGIETIMRDVPVSPQAPQFPEWLRFKTGLSPMYAPLTLARHSDVSLVNKTDGSLVKYVQAIPDVIIFTNVVNDVISFYKELAAGEKGNYIDQRADREGVSVVTALRINAEEGIAAYRRVLVILANEPEYRANFEAYARGITHFHTSSRRYRLRDLFGDLE